MEFDEIEARYILSCHPYEGRPFSELAEKYKMQFREGKREISQGEFAKAFPHAYRIYKSGRGLQDYFESLDKGSHNWLIWMFVANSLKRKLPEQILSSIIEHAEYCSVKIAEIESQIFFPSLTGEYIVGKGKFLCKPGKGYYFIHGFDDSVYIIRQASRQDFERYKNWFNSLKLPSSYLLQSLY
ncbi:MAG: hypothetical protein N3D75_03970 [Candidatus Aenigmarchaeota archaeon]|nr:hypothetical protein [Candidatus Aenigmarchaeota archaeon]